LLVINLEQTVIVFWIQLQTKSTSAEIVIFIGNNPHTTSDKAEEPQLEPKSNVKNLEEDVGIPLETATEQTEQKSSTQDSHNSCEAIRRSQKMNHGKPPDRLTELINKVTTEIIEKHGVWYNFRKEKQPL
jgi:hypothetical protein